MTVKGYQAPKIRDILIAPLTFLAVLALLFMLSSVVKRIGDAFLFIPAKLGVVQRVEPAEVREIDLRNPSPALVQLTKPGKYAVYTGDTTLLEANAVRGKDAAVWLAIKSRAAGEPISISSVERGLRPYDTPFAEGRPIFTFDIAAADQYEVNYSYREAFIFIVPDYVSGNESVIWLAYGAELAVMLLIAGLLYYPRYQRTRRVLESMGALRSQNRARVEASWEARRKREEEKARKGQ